MEPIHVVCVDDDPDIRLTMQFLIDHTPGLECSAVLESAEHLADSVASVSADVVLLDLAIPGCDSLAELSEVRRVHSATQVIVFSGRDDPATVERCMKAGAAACVTKSADPMRVLELIREVAGAAN